MMLAEQVQEGAALVKEENIQLQKYGTGAAQAQVKTFQTLANLQGVILDISDVCLGVPVILYRHGILMVVPISMDDHEKEEFLKASQSIKEATENVRKHLKENS